MRSSGSLINTLTQKITNESNLPSPSKDNMKKIEDLKKEFKEASKQREAEVQDQMEILTQEYLENIRDKESMICELRSVKDASEFRESETAMQMELLILEYSENIEDKENLICELR